MGEDGKLERVCREYGAKENILDKQNRQISYYERVRRRRRRRRSMRIIFKKPEIDFDIQSVFFFQTYGKVIATECVTVSFSYNVHEEKFRSHIISRYTPRR